MSKIDLEKMVKKASHKKNSLVRTVKDVNKLLKGRIIEKSEVVIQNGKTI